MDRETADLISYLIKAKNSLKILELLVAEGDYTSKQIQVKLGLHLSNVSRTMTDLEKRKLIKCINPKSIVKFYIPTNKGKDSLTEVEEYKKKIKR